MSNNVKNQKGAFLVEVVVIVGIIAGSLVAILGVATVFLVTSHVVQQTSKATALAQEAIEIVRNYRDGTDWDTTGLGQLTLGVPYHAEQSGSPPAWTLLGGTETITEFTREIEFEAVCRDSSDNIATCPASYSDSDTRKAIVTVSWQERGNNHEVELQAYFTNWNP
jgi:Flp pilus assembly pilin Flp